MNDDVPIDVDPTVYRLTAVKKTAYKFGDRCHVKIEILADEKIRIHLRAKRLIDNPRFLVGEFENELLDQELREQLAEETAPIRNLLLAQAFSATSLLDPQGETAAFEADPLLIRGDPPTTEVNRMA